jgi:hypothetical protein
MNRAATPLQQPRRHVHRALAPLARHVSTLLHPHCTLGPSPYIYKRKVQGSRTRRWPRGRTGRRTRLAPSLSPSRTLVTPYCKRIRPGRRTTRRSRFPLAVFPSCVPSRADPSGLGHAATIYSSVQGPPGVETPTVCVLGLHSTVPNQTFNPIPTLNPAKSMCLAG